MTSAAATTLGGLDSPRRPLITRAGWVCIAVLGLLFLGVHHVYLEQLFRIVTRASGDNYLAMLWTGLTNSWDPDWSHALVVPFISVYYIMQHRDRLAAATPRVCLWGLPLLFAGLVGYAFWTYPGRNDMFKGYSMIMGLFGLVLLLLGPGMMRVLWFPIAYLVFAVKISDAIWNAIAMKLQLIAAQGASIALDMIGVFIQLEADVAGTTITLVHRGVRMEPGLEVAQACAGLRMLMAFIALGVALAFLFDRTWWQRLIMIGMTVPIAVLVNIGRVTTLGLLHLVDPAWAKGDFHTFIGMLMLIPAAGLFLLLGWILDRIVIRDDDAGPAPAPRRARTGAEPPAPTARDWTALALASGVGLVAGVVAAGIYYVMLTIRSPGDAILGSGASDATVLLAMILKLVWIAAPVGLAGTAVAWGAMRIAPRFAAGFVRSASWTVPAAIAAGVLLSVLGLQQAVVAKTGAVFIKQPVELRRPLVLIPHQMGHWTLVQEQPPLPPDILQELGTTQYITRVYEDTTWTGGAAGRYVVLHIPYYTGTADTVPHVPDRCFLGGGATGVGIGEATVNLTGSGYREDVANGGFLHRVQPLSGRYALAESRTPLLTFPVTYFTFAERGDRGGGTHTVLYFFAANGKLLKSPNFVRMQGFDPTDKHSYYAKIEVQVRGVGDKDEAAARASDFLSVAMPEIMACLPDWVDVTAGRYPLPDTASTPTP